MKQEQLKELFTSPVSIKGNMILDKAEIEVAENQDQTREIFSDKWTQVESSEKIEKLYDFQFDWFLELYSFQSEQHLKDYLSTKPVVIDCGCGLGSKIARLAELAPESLFIGIDISDSIDLAAKNFNHLSNLYFLRADIAHTGLKPNSIDFVICDQVIMHTEDPEATFAHLSEVTKKGGEFGCYVYAKKALPRELVDDHFRHATHNIPNEKMWELSEQLTELGKRLSELKVTIHSPDIPLLGIKGGEYDIQRFIYWNFLKCFWREDLGFELCKSINYDWYAPSNARRYSKDEFLTMIRENDLEIVTFHEEEACYSGRFLKK